ncbi:MAG: hypothetical protein ACRD9L_19750, partial [Bryobacteraceae bacterium]
MGTIKNNFMALRWRFRRFSAVVCLLLALDGVAAAQSAFTGGAITVNGSTTVSTSSTAAVSGLSGTVTSITLTLNSVSVMNLNSA